MLRSRRPEDGQGKPKKQGHGLEKRQRDGRLRLLGQGGMLIGKARKTGRKGEGIRSSRMNRRRDFKLK